MSDLQTAAPDGPLTWSLGGSVAVAFPQSRSSSHAAAVSLAQQAERYQQGLVNGKATLHLAGFGRSAPQAALALALIGYLRGIKGVQYFGGGALVAHPHKLSAVLECYLQASRCTDPRAHCVVVAEEQRLLSSGSNVLPPVATRIELPPLGTPEEILAFMREPAAKPKLREFPCRYLLWRQFRLSPDHPASEADQIQAGAVREGCDWCPNLRTNSAQQ